MGIETANGIKKMIIYNFEIYRCGFETTRISITEDVVKKVSTHEGDVSFEGSGGYKIPFSFIQCFTSGCCSDKFDEAIIVSFLGHEKMDIMKFFNKFQDIVEKKSIDVDYNLTGNNLFKG